MEQKSYYDDLIERIKTIKTDKIDDTEIDQYEEETKRKMKQIGVESPDFIRRSDSTVVEKQKIYFWLRLFVENDNLDILPNDELLMEYKWAPGERLMTKFVCYGKKGLAHDHQDEIVNYNAEDDKKTLCLLVDSEVVNYSKDIPFLRKLFPSSFYFEEEIIKREDLTFTNQRTNESVIYFDADF